MSVAETKPRIALAIFRLRPAGGLEQHCLRLADILARRGVAVTIITTRPAPAPLGVAVETIPTRGLTNHGRIAAFVEDARRVVGDRFHRSVTFDVGPGFDFFFCAHPTRARPGSVEAFLPRYRTFARLERLTLTPESATRVFCLSTAQLDGLAASHSVPRERLLLLPPTIDRTRIASQALPRSAARRGGPVWLWMGLQPLTKGLDRTLTALAAAPDARLLVCGLDAASRPGQRMRRLARRLGVDARVSWLGFIGEEAVRNAMADADLLVHPSREDVTGTVILEAMASGLPVITTEICGYGEHVRAARAGVVLTGAFRDADLNDALAQARPSQLAAWSAAALAYTRRDDLFSGLERAADLILAA